VILPIIPLHAILVEQLLLYEIGVDMLDSPL
jgi:hypothetical protein